MNISPVCVNEDAFERDEQLNHAEARPLSLMLVDIPKFTQNLNRIKRQRKSSLLRQGYPFVHPLEDFRFSSSNV